MIENKVETFVKFNKGMKRPNRSRHMELCGFEICCAPFNPKDSGYNSPLEAANHRARYFNEKTGCSAHIVYYSSCRDAWGLHLYDFWVKELYKG